jgi:hypothetical protein
MKERLVLKDFLTLQKGDVISLYTGSNNILIEVINRTIDVPFYGNEKGRWGKENPMPKSIRNASVQDSLPNVHFIWVKEKVAPFTALEFKMPHCPKDLTKHLTTLYSGAEWQKICIQKIIDDLESQGVI